MAKAKTNNYIDNKKFFEALMEYKLAKEVAPPEDQPQIPEYIGECLLAIARKFSNLGSFKSYSYREELISDAVENCLLYLHNFNPEKSTNPFAYFTQITKWAFFRRIAKEKKQTYIKLKVAINQSLLGEDYDIISGEDNDLKNPNWMTYENVDNLIRDFEEKIEKKNNKYREYKQKRIALDEEHNLEDDDILFSEEVPTLFDSFEEEVDVDEDDEPKRKRNDEDEELEYENSESLMLNGDDE